MGQLFEVVTGPMEGTSYLLEEGTTLSIGRSNQNDITLPYDPWVSSSHATIKCKENTILVMDLHSSNGSYMQSKKVSPNSFVPMNEYLVLGSTLCRSSTDGKPLQRKPLPFRKSAAKALLNNSLAREALRMARDRQSPTLSILHMFMAALKLEHPELNRFLRSLKQDPDRLLARIEKFRIFTGSRDWINDFLTYQFKTKEEADLHITPLVQDYLDRFGADPFEPIDFIKQVMQEPYNLLHPMLGLVSNASDQSMPGFTEKVTLNPYSSEDSRIILPKSFWNDFSDALDSRGPVILCGTQGSGKTAILRHCFHALPKVDVHHFHNSEKHIFDPEVFLVFNEMNNLTPYLNRIIKQLRSEHLVGIDHFGFMLQLLERNHVEASPLISSIKRRRNATIVSVRAQHVEVAKDFFPKAHVLDLDKALEKVKYDILKNMILEFESDVRCPIGNEAHDFLREKLLHDYNMASIQAYFQFCAERVQSLSTIYRNDDISKKDKSLSKAFFQLNLDHWASPFQISGDHRHPQMTAIAPMSAPGGLNEEQDACALLVEKALRGFLQNHLRTPLTYPDGTSSIEDQGASGQRELIAYLEATLAAFGTGFQTWLESFLTEIAPHKALGATPEDRWDDFVAWYDELDRGFCKDHFLEQTRKALKRALRQKTLH